MRQFCLPKSEILRGKKEIDYLFQKGKYIPGRAIDLIFVPEKAKRRVLFAVSKKIKKKIDRNKIKRRLREIYRLSKQEIPESIHLALIGKPAAAKITFSELQQEFINAIRRMARL